MSSLQQTITFNNDESSLANLIEGLVHHNHTLQTHFVKGTILVRHEELDKTSKNFTCSCLGRLAQATVDDLQLKTIINNIDKLGLTLLNSDSKMDAMTIILIEAFFIIEDLSINQLLSNAENRKRMTDKALSGLQGIRLKEQAIKGKFNVRFLTIETIKLLAAGIFGEKEGMKDTIFYKFNPIICWNKTLYDQYERDYEVCLQTASTIDEVHNIQDLLTLIAYRDNITNSGLPTGG